MVESGWVGALRGVTPSLLAGGPKTREPKNRTSGTVLFLAYLLAHLRPLNRTSEGEGSCARLAGNTRDG